MKKSFVLYNDQYEAVEDLTDKQKGQLLDAMFLYSRGEDLKECDPVIKIVFKFFKIVFDRDNLKWTGVANRNKENGKKGGRPKGSKNSVLGNNPEQPRKPSGLNGFQEKPRKAVSVSGSVSDSVTLVEVIDNIQAEFEMFWDAYAKKKDRDKCFSKWKKLKQSEKDSIFESVYLYVQYTPDKQYRKNPLTWLNGKCWEDEIVKPMNEAERRLVDNINNTRGFLDG